MYARMHAERGDAVGMVGQAAKAVFEEAQVLFAEIPDAPERMLAWVGAVERRLSRA